MFLRATLRRNPKLIEVAFRFHQAGVIPPNTYVIDLDAVSANAGVIKKASNEAGLSLYAMTKQFGRNPLVMGEIARRGIPKAVAVDTEEAKVLARHRIEIGHVGHLVQVPTIEVRRVLEMRPEVLTVFSVAKARQVSIACQELGLHQDLLLRVRSVGDFFYPAQEGGVDESGLLDAAVEIQRLPGVRL
ncbi:MAG: alanine racemase, partial [Bacillota bacterium]